MIVSHTLYIWSVTLMAWGLGGSWTIVELVRLRRALAEDRRDPVVRDRIFGSLVGLLICVVGVALATKYHL